MKLKGLTKLALSGVALAAVAATLGTSTYAWYVSNTTASVSGANGSTAGAETSGSLYAATPTMYANDRWSNKVTLAAGTDYTNTNKLVPVTKVTSALTSAYNEAQVAADSNWTDVTPTIGTGTSATAAEFCDKGGVGVAKENGAYLEFNFWLVQRGNKNEHVTASVTITNTTTDFSTTQKAYTAAHLPGSGLSTNETFKVDAVHALRVEITNSNVIDASTASAASAATTTTSKTSVHTVDDDFETYTTADGFDDEGDGDANLYYASLVNGINLYGCSSATENSVTSLCGSTTIAENPWTGFYLKPDTPTQLTFKVWLEGTDKDCFDSCVGQSFKFDFNFELA